MRKLKQGVRQLIELSGNMSAVGFEIDKKGRAYFVDDSQVAIATGKMNIASMFGGSWLRKSRAGGEQQGVDFAMELDELSLSSEGEECANTAMPMHLSEDLTICTPEGDDDVESNVEEDPSAKKSWRSQKMIFLLAIVAGVTVAGFGVQEEMDKVHKPPSTSSRSTNSTSSRSTNLEDCLAEMEKNDEEMAKSWVGTRDQIGDDGDGPEEVQTSTLQIESKKERDNDDHSKHDGPLRRDLESSRAANEIERLVASAKRRVSRS